MRISPDFSTSCETNIIKLTIDRGVIWLNVDTLDLAILNNKGITLAALISEEWGGVKEQIEGLGESTGGIGQEVELQYHT